MQSRIDLLAIGVGHSPNKPARYSHCFHLASEPVVREFLDEYDVAKATPSAIIVALLDAIEEAYAAGEVERMLEEYESE